MRHLFPGLVLLAALALPATAQETAAVLPEGRTMTDASPLPAEEADLDAYLWTARPVVVFADSDADPRFVEQMELLDRGASALEERDVVVITDTDPAARSAIRQKLRPRGFMLVLIGKAWADPGAAMADGMLRFYTVEHAFGMVVAVGAALVALKVRSRRKALVAQVLWLIVTLVSIPWPLMEYGRPLFRL